jgi:hypothetical protein
VRSRRPLQLHRLHAALLHQAPSGMHGISRGRVSQERKIADDQRISASPDDGSRVADHIVERDR